MKNFILPFPPSVNTKYNISRGKRCKSEKVKNWIAKATDCLNQQNILPVTYRCFIVYELSHPDNKQRDAANYEKYTTDFLVEQGVLRGDDRKYIKGILTQWLDIPGDYIKIQIIDEKDLAC